jgi:hypothetical protein
MVDIERRCQAIMKLLRERDIVQLVDDNALHGLAMEIQYAIAQADLQVRAAATLPESSGSRDAS